MSKSVHQADFGPLCHEINSTPDEYEQTPIRVNAVLAMEHKLLGSLSTKPSTRSLLQRPKPSLSYLSPKDTEDRELEQRPATSSKGLASQSPQNSFPAEKSSKALSVQGRKPFLISNNPEANMEELLSGKSSKEAEAEDGSNNLARLAMKSPELKPMSSPLPSMHSDIHSLLTGNHRGPIMVDKAVLRTVGRSTGRQSTSQSILKPSNGSPSHKSIQLANELDLLASPVSRPSSPSKKVTFSQNMIVIQYHK